MRVMTRTLGTLLAACSFTAALAADLPAYKAPAFVPKTGIGFRGDGTGVFSESKPPTTWDEATGQNILWTAPLPNFGYACPVAVGNRVFMMTEPGWKAVFPQLTCFDADTGAELWQRDIDPFLPFAGVTPEKHKELTEDLAWTQELYRQAYRITGELATRGGAAPDSPEVAKANEELAKYGMKIRDVRMNYGQLRSLSFLAETQTRMRAVEQKLRPYGVTNVCTWQDQGEARIGYCFSTPVSDGECLYVMTLHGTVSCYDMDGNLKWTRWSGYSQGRNTGLTASPRLYGDLLLTPFYDWAGKSLIAWDKRTGELRWVADVPKVTGPCDPHGCRPHASPVIMSVGNTDVVLTGTGHVVRLPDGKVYDAKIGTPEVGTWAVDDDHDAIYFSTSGDGYAGLRCGIKLAMVNDDLTVTSLYALPKGSGQSSPLFAGGKLFYPRAQADPATGIYLGGQENSDPRRLPQSAPDTRHVMLAANGHVYGLRDGQQKTPEGTKVTAICEVFTLDGKPVASNTLTVPALRGEKISQWLQQGFPNSFSYSCSMNIGGDRLYIASKDMLYCIGEKQQ